MIPLASLWVGRFSGIPVGDLIRSGEKMFEAQIKAYERVGYDALFGYSDPMYVPEALGCELRILKTGLQTVPLSVKTTEDIDRLPTPDPQKDGRIPAVLKAVRLLSKYSKGKIPVVPGFEEPLTAAVRTLEADFLMRKMLSGTNTNNSPLILGNRIDAVQAGAEPALGNSSLRIEFYNNSMGAPLLDLVQLLSFPSDVGLGLRNLTFTSDCLGELHSAFGVPEGTPGEATVAMVNLQMNGVGPNVPVDNIMVEVAQ